MAAAAGGAALGAAPFIAGGPLALVGGAVGGLVGYFGGSALVGKVQNAALNAMPDLARAIGQDPETQQADEAAHPIAAYVGGLVPQLLTLHPGASLLDIAKAGKGLATGTLTKAGADAAKSAVARMAIGSGAMGGIEAGQEYANDGSIDPTKVAIAAGAGAAFTDETPGFGTGLSKLGAGVAHSILPSGVVDKLDLALGRTPTPPPPEPTPPPAAPQPGTGLVAVSPVSDMSSVENQHPGAATAPEGWQAGEGPAPGSTQPFGPAPQPVYVQQPVRALPDYSTTDAEFRPVPGVGQDENRAPPNPTLQLPAPAPAATLYGTAEGGLAPDHTQDVSFTAIDIAKRLAQAATPGKGTPPTSFAHKLAAQLALKFNAMDAPGADALVLDHMDRSDVDKYSGPQQAMVSAAVDEVSAFKRQYADILPKPPEAAPAPVDPTQGTPGPIAPTPDPNPLAGISANDVASDAIRRQADIHNAYTQGHRDALLSGVLDNPESHSPTASFLDALRSKGHDDTIQPNEATRIARFEQAKEAFEKNAPAPAAQIEEPAYHGTGDFVADRDAALENEHGQATPVIPAEGQANAPAEGQVNGTPAQEGGQAHQADVLAAEAHSAPTLRAPGEDPGAPVAPAAREPTVVQREGDAPIRPEQVQTAPEPTNVSAREVPREPKPALLDMPPPTEDGLASRINSATAAGKITAVERHQLISLMADGHDLSGVESDLNYLLRGREAAAAAAERATPMTEGDVNKAFTPQTEAKTEAKPPVVEKVATYPGLKKRVDALHADGTFDADQHQHYTAMIEAKPPVHSPGIIARSIERDVNKAGTLKMAAPSRRDILAGGAVAPLVASHALAEGRTPIPTKGFEAVVRGGDANKAVGWLATNAKSPLIRTLAEKMKLGGMGDVKIRVVDPDSAHASPRDVDRLDNALGSTEPLTGDIVIADRHGSPTDGMNEETVGHELLHGYLATRYRELSMYNEDNKALTGFNKAQAGDAAISKWTDMWRSMSTVLQSKFPDMVANDTWASEFARSPDEALTWMMTHQPAQDFLKTVNLEGEKLSDPTGTSMWSRVVDWVRSIFGLPKSVPDSALSNLLDAGNAVIRHAALDAPNSDFAQRVQAVGEKNGQLASPLSRKADPALPKDPMKRTALDIGTQAGVEKAGNILMNVMTVGQIAEGAEHLPIYNELDRIHHGISHSAWKKSAGIESATHVQDDWIKLNTGDRAAMDKIIMDATMQGVDVHEIDTARDTLAAAQEARDTTRGDPSASVGDKKKTEDDLTKAQANKDRLDAEPPSGPVHDAYAALSPAAKKVFDGSFKTWRDMRDWSVKLHSEIIHEGPGTAAEKAAMVARYKASVGRQVYAPAKRIGDFTTISTKPGYGESRKNLEAATAHLERVRAEGGGVSPERAAAQKGLDDATNALHKLAEKDNATPAQLVAARQARTEAKGKLDAIPKGDPDKAALSAALDAHTTAAEAHDKSVNDDENYVREQQESRSDQLKHKAEMEAKGYTVQPMLTKEFQPTVHGPATALMSHIDKIIAHQNEVNPHLATGNNAVLRMIHDVANTLQPQSSGLKTVMHRRGTPGWNTDTMRVYSQEIRRANGFLSAVESGRALRQGLVDMEAKIKAQPFGTDTTRMDAISHQLNKHFDALSKYVHQPVQQFLNSAAYAWFLGCSPSLTIGHLAQTPMVTWPMLAARFGGLRSSAKLLDAFAEVAGGTRKGLLAEGKEGNWGKTARERAGMRFAIEANTITSTHTSDLLAAGDRSTPLKRAGRAVMDLAGFMPHYTEKANRITTVLASMRLSEGNKNIHAMLSDERYATMLKDQPWLKAHTREEVAEFRYANKLTTDSHIDYGSDNMSYAMQPGVLPLNRLFSQFQKYQQGMIYQLVHQAGRAIDINKELTPAERWVARKTLLGIVGTHTMLTGAMGLPLYGMGAVVLNLAHKADEDNPYDNDDHFRTWLEEHIGKDAGDVVARGLLYAPGIRKVLPGDVTDRLGMGDLLASSNAADGVIDKNSIVQYIGATLGGPAASLLSNIGQAVQLHKSNENWKAAELLAPKALRDISRVARFQMEGVTTSSHNQVVRPNELSFMDLAAQAVGYTPQVVESAYANRAAVEHAKASLGDRRKELMKRYTDAMVSGDDGGADHARQDVAKYNETQMNNGTYLSEAITGGELARSVQQRRLASYRMHDGVSYTPKERGLVDAYSTVDEPDE